MPHGESWFSIFLGNLYASALRLAATLGERTWVGHTPIQLHHVFGWLLVFCVVMVLAALAARRTRNVKKALIPEARLSAPTLVELLVESTYGLMVGVMGRKAAKHFLPLIGTCAFLILFSNALGFLPGFSAPTDTLNTTAACALVIFFATHIYGVKEHGIAYFKHFFGPIIKWYALPFMLLLFVIETISHLVRPVTLAIRLAANMTADHAVLGQFLDLVPWFVPLPIYVLGSIVVVVQTLVFCLLSTVYIALAIEHEEH